MRKGKSRMRARTDSLRANARRPRAAYDQHRYDGSDPDASESPPRGTALNDNQER